MNLPSENGFDSSWEITEYPKYTKCVSSFHCMNEDGYYDGYAYFSVIIFKQKKDTVSYPIFNLHFHGQQSHYLAKKYMLREYIEDTIACYLMT